MPRIKLKQVDGIRHTTASYALDAFLRHCQLKNLSPYSLRYYDKNMKFFLEANPEVKYVDEITQEVINNFISAQMDKGNRVTAINARLRAVNVFLRYCFEQEYLEPYPLSLIKEDETFKEPYTDAELKKLLKVPQGDRWTEWREWAIVKFLLATGVRASTAVNIKISDIDFEHNIIRLRKLKNRRQQNIPLSTSLKSSLELYLRVWDWDSDNYLFPGSRNMQMQAHTLEERIRTYNISRGVTKTSTHLFRHTFAKNYILAGGGTKESGPLISTRPENVLRNLKNALHISFKRQGKTN